MVEDSCSGFSRDKDAGAGIPWLVAEHDAGVKPPLGGPCEVYSRRAKHPYPLCALMDIRAFARVEVWLTRSRLLPA